MSSMLPRSVGIHDGSFHADEVTACALLLLYKLINRDHIYRTRDPHLLDQCEYVCDVGGIYDPNQKRFDHHQIEYQGPLSSAGMVLLYLREQGIIDFSLYMYWNRALILGVDAHDNGISYLPIGVCSFSNVISNFLPIEYESSPAQLQQAFQNALDFALGHLSRLLARHEYVESCRLIVQQVMEISHEVLVFDHPIPWMENFFEIGGASHPAQFLIMPSGVHWKLRGIPPSLEERMQVRNPLPQSWAGLQGEALQQLTGISGAIFCHKGRFLSIWKTKEDALQALRLAIYRT